MSWNVPEWAAATVELLTHPVVLLVLGAGSLVLFVLGIAGVPWFVARLPVDYFSRDERVTLGLGQKRHPLLRALLRFARNLLGAVLFVLGVAMLVLPGQGIVAIIVSLFLLDFPGKVRCLRYVVHRPVVFRGLNAIRVRAGKPPLRPAQPNPESGE